MPKEYYADWWWDDLPEKAKKAAAVLGYDKTKWDNSESIPYDSKTYKECSEAEKQAAMFLGMNPLATKFEIYWSECDQKTKDEAVVLGYNQENWDDDWYPEDLPCNEWSWSTMTDAQKKAAMYFGYTQSTWDETWDEIDFSKKPKKNFTPMTGKPFTTSNTATTQPAQSQKPQKESTEHEENDSGFIDNLCSKVPCGNLILAPYKILFAPLKMVANLVTHKK
jgi:hypothetical protein